MQDMPAPTNKAEMETILEMINYLWKFTLNLSEATSPMRQLLGKDSYFTWGDRKDGTFERVKAILTSNQSHALTYFDHSKPTTLQVNTSKNSLGITLLQNGKQVVYASKSLIQSERNYAQIEKELFAILFRYKRSHH